MKAKEEIKAEIVRLLQEADNCRVAFNQAAERIKLAKVEVLQWVLGNKST